MLTEGEFEEKVEKSLKRPEEEIRKGVYEAYKVPKGGKENIASFLEFY